MANEFDHDDAEAELTAELSWPQYFVSGEDMASLENFVPAYYRVEGPNGPVSYRNSDSEPYPMTMYELVMDSLSEDFREIDVEDTPWSDN